jgi:hypothetical protein
VTHPNRRLGYFPEPDAHGTTSKGRSAPLWKRPFFLFGAGLLNAGKRQGSVYLMRSATVIGGAGILFWIITRLWIPLGESWAHPAVFLLLGFATVAAGLAVRTGGSRRLP